MFTIWSCLISADELQQAIIFIVFFMLNILLCMYDK